MMNLDEIKSRINPLYANCPGTESHERKWLCDLIDGMVAERDALASELKFINSKIPDSIKLATEGHMESGVSMMAEQITKAEAEAKREREYRISEVEKWKRNTEDPMFSGRIDTWQAACGIARNERDQANFRLKEVATHCANVEAERDALAARLAELAGQRPIGEVIQYDLHPYANGKYRHVIMSDVRMGINESLYARPIPATCDRCPHNPDVVCASCEGAGTVTDTDGVKWKCPYGCHSPIPVEPVNVRLLEALREIVLSADKNLAAINNFLLIDARAAIAAAEAQTAIDPKPLNDATKSMAQIANEHLKSINEFLLYDVSVAIDAAKDRQEQMMQVMQEMHDAGQAVSPDEYRGGVGVKRLTDEEICQIAANSRSVELARFLPVQFARAIEAAILGVEETKNGEEK